MLQRYSVTRVCPPARPIRAPSPRLPRRPVTAASTDFAGLGGGSADAGGGFEEAGERDAEAERIDREALEARLGRGGYAVGAMWDEGNMVHAIRKFGGTTMGWRFGDG